MTEQELCTRMGIPMYAGNPQEMLQRLMATRNEWKLYKRTCDKTGQGIISAYPPETPFPVYTNSVWWGDSWSALDYGRDFDFKRPFFDQFKELQSVVPREGTSLVNCENSDYNSHIRESRNCYLNSLMVGCEDVLYSYWMVQTKDTLDSMTTHHSTLCYWCSDVENAYNCVLLEIGRDCADCFFSFDLKNCRYCIFSYNLVNKDYYAFNKPCSKEEFEDLKKTYLNGSWTSWQQGYATFLELRRKAIHRYAQILNSENCTGDHIYSCKSCTACYDCDECEDCFNAVSGSHSKNIMHAYSAGWKGCEMVYCSCVTRGSIDIAYCTYTWWSHRLRYCDSCASCSDCFGCIGLRHKQYCILNKQYSKDEYEDLVPRIIAHMGGYSESGATGAKGELSIKGWGQFFPKQLSVFAYNESAANDYFPCSREEALEMGFRWKDQDAKEYFAPSYQLSDGSEDVSETITGEILACERCRKNYRIIPQELVFYRKMRLPIPRHCPSCRHKNRFRLRNLYRLNQRPCTHCKKDIRSTYAPDRTEAVYCDSCYLNTVY